MHRTRQNKNLKSLLIAILIFLLLGIPSYIWTKKNVSALSGRYNAVMTPIIMIPGSDSNASRLDGLIKAVDQKYGENHSVLKVTVKTNNQVTYSGSIRSHDQHPFIVVGFQNSGDGFSNIKKQVVWFNIAFNDLRKKYQFHSFDAFGHSNGALIWTYFLEDYFDETGLQINHLMTIGAPFNFEETNPDNHTEMLNQLIKGRQNLPSNMSYYSVAGTKQYFDDGIVPLSSVDSGKYIYQNQVKLYTLITLTGSNDEHSDMLTNPQFITLFHQFIVQENSNRKIIDSQNNRP